MNPTQKLIEAAEAVCDRWDSPLWKDAKPTADYIATLREAVRGLREAGEPVAGVHWYCLAATGTAMLCTDEEDARHEAEECDRLYPMHAPHRAVQLVPAAPPSHAPQPAQDGASK